MALHELTSEPVFMTVEEHSRLQEATPSSFEGHAPVLRLKLEGVRCCLQPEAAFQIGESSGSNHAQNGNGSHSIAQQGTLWVTESQVSFLPPSGRGFSLQYPSIALHAISRTLPPSLQALESTSASPGCLYCQLENEGDEEEEEEEDQSALSELWILPSDPDQLEPLFETLSYCASLHPSEADAEDEGGSHPFAGVGPFGTGILGQGDQDQDQMDADGAFEDADEDNQDGDIPLSETGRATLAHLDSLLDGTSIPLSPLATATASSPPASFHSADPRKTTTTATNSLILVHLPDEIFTHPPLAASLLDLLHAFGDLASWTPLPSFGRALIVYEEVEGARRAKESLDRLLLPLIEEGLTEQMQDVEIESAKRSLASDKDEESSFLRAYFGPMTVLSSKLGEDEDRLEVPTTDRNFLISPPGSPPVGWEPIKEDPPNKETLADDLIRALGSLRDKGLGVQGHQPKPLQEEAGNNDNGNKGGITPPGLLPPPSLVIAPSQAAVRSRHPLARQTYDAGDNASNGEDAMISIPGVVVQSMDRESDQEDDVLDERMNKGLSISSVKATVDSMKGPFAASSKITPTGRPPLA